MKQKSALYIALLAWLAFACSALAQPFTPRIGYVYPAGGRQGATFQVVVGGQYLDGVTNAYVTSGGVQAAVIDFNKPMPQGQFNMLRDMLRELQEKKAAAAKSTRKGRTQPSTNDWTAADEKLMADIRAKMLKNPPNRNASPAIAETATLRVTLAPDAEPGEREIRLGTPTGLSNPLVFHVGQLLEFSEPPAKAANPDADRFRQRAGRLPVSVPVKTEPRITLPATINGQITPGAVDRYRFTARQGQQLVAAVSARALIPYLADAVPGWFQPTLALYDSQGKELAYDDDFRFHPDPVLHCEIPKDGEYLIEIKDAIYRGREDFVYRITLGELPFVTGIFPLGGPVGAPTKVEMKGWNLPQVIFTPPSAKEPGLQLLSLRKGELISNRVPFVSDTLPEAREQEPNPQPENAQAVKLPVIINGRIDQPGDADVFRFEGDAGDVIVAEVQARRLDSPLDSLLKLTDATGRQLAFNDDHEDKASGLNTHHADAYLRATLPGRGTYYLHLGDTQRKGGSEYAYRLRISPPRPDFELRVVPASINARGGMSVPLTVYALRKDGFSNEIAIALKDAPTGFTLSGARVPANQDQVRLTLSVPPRMQKEPLTLALEGSATIAGREITQPAVPAEDMMQAFAYRHLVPAKELKAEVSGRGMGRGAVRILGALPVKIPVGGTARVQVGMPPNALAGRLHLELSEPPEGLTIKNVSPAGQGTEILLQCDAAKVKPGLAGNLIVQAFAERAFDAAKGKAKTGPRRAPLGTLPAIPFEIVAR